MRVNKITVLLLTVGILSAACTTQKRRGDLSSLGKLYHNTTAKFNGYFNANEIMIASIAELETQHQDNYNNLLEVYRYMKPDNPQAIASELDNAIKKVSVVVNLHRESVWTDDCYLLIGKAQFLKQDFEGAEQTFRYLINEFRPDKYEKKYGKKGKKGKSRSGSNNSRSVEDEEDKRPQTKKEKKRAIKVKKKEKTKRAKEKQKEAKRKSKERKKYNAQVKKNRKRRKKGKVTGVVQKPSSRTRKKDGEQDKVGVTGSLEDEKAAEEEKEADVAEEEIPEEIIPESISIFGDEQVDIESDPEKYFLKHRPVYQEGLMWLAKALIERDNFDAALRYIGQLESSSGTFEDVRLELSSLKAYLYIKRNQYQNALPPLEEAIELSSKSQNKARYAFIHAQIQQMLGNAQGALGGFQSVLKYGPDYEMAFSAKLAMAQNLLANGGASKEETTAKLKKMLKDFKNVEYKDKIYYALANIALQSGDRAEGIKYLELSLKNSVRNSLQKSESYYKLAQLYFEDDRYVEAKSYYDSTLQVLNLSDPRYSEVKKFSTNLTDIAKNLQIIELQDSLLAISNLSEEDKKALAYEIKKKQNEAKRAALARASNPPSALTSRGLATTPSVRPGQAGGALAKESAFFAYNDRNLKRGKREFSRKWGARSLTDNWRLSSRQSALENGASGQIDEEVVEAAITDDDIKNILKDVPKDKKEQEVAKVKIKEAMFTLGKLYRDVLGNNEKSTEAMEALNERFPGNTFELNSWYYMYLAYGDLNNNSKKQEYYNKIIGKYPSTNYAKILQDPNYLAQLLDEEQKLNLYYDDAYADFENGKFQQAYSKSLNAKTKFGAANIFQPRFALLSAMCIGNLQGKEAYVAALKEVVGKYPNTDEQKRAREILRLLGGAVASLPGGKSEASKKFNVEDDKLHYIIVSFDGDVKINDKKNSISDFNKKFYKLEKLRITPLFLGSDPQDRKPMIVIRRFKNKLAAMQYYEGIQANSGDFIKDDEGVPYNIFAVSQNNYREILRSKSIEGYKDFFDDNYLD